MKSYIKIYGPPLLKTIKVLEKVAIGLPEVCVWNTVMASSRLFTSSGIFSDNDVRAYFSSADEMPERRCSTIISKSGESIGEYDFFFEWFKEPTMEELNNFIEKIDEALAPLNVRYALVTK
jgi:hypothetical protein